MSDTLAIAERELLAPAELDASALERVVGDMLSPQIDYADIYLQHSRSESWMLEDGIVRDGSFSIDRGVGLRAVAGERTGFACSDDLSARALVQAAGAARQIARSGSEGTGRFALKRADAPALYTGSDPLTSISDAEKTALLERVDRLARSLDPAITQVSA
ncbi:MAG: metalloprotease TldD, partial [Pseudomonadales bacterium]|nr:metalloprotease TldD [Pseudomonadales bacterium]